DAELPIARHLQRYFKEQDASPVISHRFDNMDTLKSAVAVTNRFAVLPMRCVQREAEAGTLRAIRLTPKLTRPMGVLTRGGVSELAPAPRAFLDDLVRAAGPASGQPPADAGRQPADASR
ncbi:MAG: LysR substrate-binding domain-containing protein, partial [Phycisphaeraceae bacterium]